jgi:hypothetical protein
MTQKRPKARLQAAFRLGHLVRDNDPSVTKMTQEYLQQNNIKIIFTPS